MCAACPRSEVEITEGLQKHVVICYCPECDCYLQPPTTWIKAQVESKKLLTFCVKRLKNLNTVRVVHAEFGWTEPHSKRIKYVVQDQLCKSCARVRANPDQWVAAVQLRQRVSHKRTFFYLEQLILKHNAAKDAIRIKQMDQGIDFFFANRSHGEKFVEFVGKVAPIKRGRDSRQLVSHDTKSSTGNYKCTFSVEISPVCREDLICLPPEVAVSLGNVSPLVICHKVSNDITLLDPLTLRQCLIDADQYWRRLFKALLSSRQLAEYIVLDVEPISNSSQVSSNCVLADAHVARVSDFGKNDRHFVVRTHLGRRLIPGDYVLGYDLYGANSNDMELDKYKCRRLNIPDVILIKKSYEEKRQRRQGKSRSWRLKSLNMEVEKDGRDHEKKMNSEYEDFLRDLEEDPELRFNMSLYRDKEYRPLGMDEDEDVPCVPLDELADDDDDDDDDRMVE
ncbi:hypothetical protein OROHE_010647 [Orobanche hederae]